LASFPAKVRKTNQKRALSLAALGDSIAAPEMGDELLAVGGSVWL
jgi:hypothetical protein